MNTHWVVKSAVLIAVLTSLFANDAMAARPTGLPPGQDKKIKLQKPTTPTETVATNTAPTISGTPPSSVLAGQSYNFTPVAVDSDGDALSFGIVNKPSWASFSSATGKLSGVPSEAAAGEYIEIAISVSDGQATASLSQFGVVVNVPNHAPTISGTPVAAVTAGQAYRFKPAASDADGDALSFSIANKPVWASFNSATGELSGTPTVSAVGVHSDVQIRVSDGELMASLPTFSVAVEQVSMGSATLSWQAPTQRTDGSPLVDLAGYRVVYGNASGQYSYSVKLDNPGTTTYVIDNLSQGTWYFAMTAFDSTGAESDYSSEGTKTVL